jgi:transglutaminase-like putative cysteine protease
MRLDIRYRTELVYDDLVRESQNELRACPASDDFQQLIGYRVTTSPASRVQSYIDYWGTRVDAFGFRQPHLALELVAEASVETHPRPLVTVASRLDDLHHPGFVDEHVEYLGRSPHAHWGPGVQRAADHVLEMADDVVGLVLAVHRMVGTAMRYVPGSTYIGVDIEDVLTSGEGVCQDFAHLAVAICRAAHVPARYVSGYLFTVDDSTGAIDDQEAVEVQTHAWFEAAVPRFGWLALDPTNQQPVGTRHVKIGHGRDYDDVPPIRGAYSGDATPTVDAMVEMRRPQAEMTVPARAERRPPAPRRSGRRRSAAADPDELVQQQQQSQQ